MKMNELPISALRIETAESEIRIAVRDGELLHEPRFRTEEKVKKIIERTLKELPATMTDFTERSLYNFYRRTSVIASALPFNLLLLATAMQGERRADIPNAPYISQAKAEQAIQEEFADLQFKQYGVPNQVFQKEYFDKQVKPIINRLSETQALDPDNVDRRQSLRNKAEMQARFDFHTQNREELERQGVRLVIISAHADCSERCRPYQGKVFSLDGTSGKTTDGRSYVPLETATNVYARSASGKIYPYFNGLFGFNCRHYMVAYKDGFKMPVTPADIVKKEYAITKRQREYERAIRKEKIEAEMNKGINKAEYMRHRKKAQRIEARYIEFSKKANRAYYPSRTKLL